MRLLECDSAGHPRLTKDLISHDIPKYAILSHTWGAEEVTFRDLIDDTAESKAGYDKIQFCAQQAANDGLQFFWVDTCCIDKSSSAELQEAINSMFRWYQGAAKCYVYLSDVSGHAFDKSNQMPWESEFQKSRWFTRGWTLQELLAPDSVEFFSQEGERLGDKRTLEQQVHEITDIAVSALQGAPLSQFRVDERFSWARKRQTTREEDKAYSLLGVFNIYMPLIYGEGTKNAFKRLQEEIDKSSKDAVKGEPKTSDPRTQPMTNVGESTLTNVSQSAVDGVRLCLLSLDGGGLRGLSSLYILKTVMTYLNAERKKNGLKEIEKPCEAFDLIGGTSTGGLIAIMLGRLRMSVDDCIKAYSDLIDKISTTKPRFSFGGLGTKRYDGNVLKDTLQSVILAYAKEKEHEPFVTTDHDCKVFVCTGDGNTDKNIVLRSYTQCGATNLVSFDLNICEAALATFAAPSIFNKVKIKNYVFDCAKGESNPIEVLVREAEDMWEIAGDDELSAKLGCIVSIGTGINSTDSHENALKCVAGTLRQMVIETEKTEKSFSRKWNQEKKYYRFNLSTHGDVGLEEHKEKFKIGSYTREYLEHGDRKNMMRDCAKNMVGDGNYFPKISSLINSGQDYWFASSPLRERISSAHRDFKRAESLLEQHQNQTQQYWLTLIDIRVCMASNYRLAAMDWYRSDNQIIAANCLDTGQKYLNEAEEKIEMGDNQEKKRCQVSLERLFLEEANIYIKSSSGVIDKAAARSLLEKAIQLLDSIHSALNNYPNLSARAQDLVNLVNEDLKMAQSTRPLPS